MRAVEWRMVAGFCGSQHTPWILALCFRSGSKNPVWQWGKNSCHPSTCELHIALLWTKSWQSNCPYIFVSHFPLETNRNRKWRALWHWTPISEMNHDNYISFWETPPSRFGISKRECAPPACMQENEMAQMRDLKPTLHTSHLFVLGLGVSQALAWLEERLVPIQAKNETSKESLQPCFW